MDVLLNESYEEQRVFIELFYIENKAKRNCFEYLNIPLGTVKSRPFSSKEILTIKIREMEKSKVFACLVCLLFGTLCGSHMGNLQLWRRRFQRFLIFSQLLELVQHK